MASGANIGALKATAYVCAQPATATATSTYFLSNVNGAIDCDLDAAWNSGGWAEATYTNTFPEPRVFSGLHITSNALPAETQTYEIVGYKADNTEVTITENFTIGDLSNPTVGGTSSKVFDLGEGFVEYTSVKVTILGITGSWKSIREVELIISKYNVKPEDGKSFDLKIRDNAFGSLKPAKTADNGQRFLYPLQFTGITTFF